MAYRFPARKLMITCCIAAITLSACDTPSATTPSPSDGENFTPAEADLRARSAAMQKTVVEAVALGGLTGLAAKLLLQNIGDNTNVTNLGFGGFFSIGAVGGAVAGTYIAHLQNNYANEESRIAALRADLAANMSETRATVQVMQVVLGNQLTELRRLQAAVNAGTADSAALNREIAEAQANLAEMDAAANGATGRFNEFSDARNAIEGAGAAGVDSELQQLSQQIAQMRSIAENLAAQV